MGLFERHLRFKSEQKMREEYEWHAEDTTGWLDKEMKEACDLSVPRVGRSRAKRSMYWWSDDLGNFRKRCILCRRKLTKAW